MLRDRALLLKGKTGSLVLDPQDSVSFQEVDIVILSEKEKKLNSDKLEICGPGEYEVKGIKILGLAVGGKTNYEIKIDELRLAVVYGKIEEKYEEAFSDLDILLLSYPIEGAQELILKLEPKIVVLYYANNNYKTEDAIKFLKDVGRENVVPTSRVVIKKDNLPAELEVVWLN